MKKHDLLPDQISTSVQDGYFESNTEEFWQLAEVDSAEIVAVMNQLLEKATWGNDDPLNRSWKTYTEFVDHDAALSINSATGNIAEFSFRADLREKDLTFLMEMISLGTKHNWLFMDIKGNLAHPEWNQVKELIIKSNAHRFLLDPEKFLRELGNGKTKME